MNTSHDIKEPIRTKCLDEEGEIFLILDEIIDFKTIRCTVGSTSDNQTRHFWRVNAISCGSEVLYTSEYLYLILIMEGALNNDCLLAEL